MHEADDGDPNPRLEIFTLSTLGGTGYTCAAITCPNCGHFSQIATYKIRQFLDERDGKNA